MRLRRTCAEASCPDNKAQRRRRAKGAAQGEHQRVDREPARLRRLGGRRLGQARPARHGAAPPAARAAGREASGASVTGFDSADGELHGSRLRRRSCPASASWSRRLGAVSRTSGIGAAAALAARRGFGASQPATARSRRHRSRAPRGAACAATSNAFCGERLRIDEAAEAARQRRLRQQRPRAHRPRRAVMPRFALARQSRGAARRAWRSACAWRAATRRPSRAWRICARADSSRPRCARRDLAVALLDVTIKSQALAGAVRKEAQQATTAPAAVIRTLNIAFPCGSASGPPMGTWPSGINLTRLRQSCRNSGSMPRATGTCPALATHRADAALFRDDASVRRKERAMRLILGMILGAALTVGGAYVSDTATKSGRRRRSAPHGQLGRGRAQHRHRRSTMIKQGWAKLTG